MDFGEATYTNSLNNVSDPVLIIKSQRYVGFSYRFHKKNLSQYACASCKILGKTRVVTVKDGRICGRKHPEDEHHKDCRPKADVEINSQSTRDDSPVGHSRRDNYEDYSYSQHDPPGDPENAVEASKYS
jgi:hypothetical protein